MLPLESFPERSALECPRQGIVWLASYPKSGNTWFRIFLRNLFHEPEEDDELCGVSGISSSRKMFDYLSGLDSSDLTAEEIDGFRPRVYEELVLRSKSFPLFMKAHDAFTFLPNGEPLMSKRATAGAIYFIRNPLDVAVSFAYQIGQEDFAKVVETMGRRETDVSQTTDRMKTQLRQHLLDWSGHVRSWVNQTDMSVHVVRYEDMLYRPLETFRGAIQFAGLGYDDQQIAAALEAARFEKLQQKERDRGFLERFQNQKLFFREGRAGSWRNKLTPEGVARIIADHGDVMREYQYLDENNVVLV